MSFNYKKPFFWLFICLLSFRMGLGYEFTSKDGRTLSGRLIQVAKNQVTIERGFDGKVFSLLKSRFTMQDQNYFNSWSEQGMGQKYELKSGEKIKASAKSLRIDLIWLRENWNHFEVQRSQSMDGPWDLMENPTSSFHLFSDYIGESGKTFFYRVRGSNLKKNKIIKSGKWSEVVSATSLEYDRSSLLDDVQEAAVRFFVEEAHPMSSLAPEGKPGWGNVCAIGSSGMGITTLIVGSERQFISRKKSAFLVCNILKFLVEKAESHKGAFGHWIDGESGLTKNFGGPKNSVDIVETSFILQAAIISREYFDRDNAVESSIRTYADYLSDSMQWNHFLVDGKNGPHLVWHWHPDLGFSDLPINGFHEAMMPYILGLASERYPIPVESFLSGWMNGGRSFGPDLEHFGIKHSLGRGIGWPLFFAHYSHIGFDPKKLIFKEKTYFDHFTDAVRIHKLYAESRASEFKGYDKLWGLAASLSPNGYRANHPGKNDDGTIATTASLSSMPYLPEEILDSMDTMYLDYGHELWGCYGFYNAINPTDNWVGKKYIGIELGPIAPMIENYRSGLFWNLFMKSREAKRACALIAADEKMKIYIK